jgi:acetyl esterase
MSHLRNPRALLTPTMRHVLDRMARAGRLPLHAMPPAQARQAYEVGASVLDLPPRRLLRVEDLVVPARDGADLPLRLYAPVAGTAGDAPVGEGRGWPVLVYFHGGGFMVGSIATHDSLCRHLAHLGGCAVVSVDYRRAPEHRFPVAVDDAWDALAAVQAHAGEWGLDGTRMAVGGDSAGGTLATVCATLARDAGVPLALQLLFYPGCSAHQDTASHRHFGHGFLLDTALIDFFFDAYLSHAGEREDWRFAPLETPDLDGVAPVWIGLAECDPLVDEGLLYADRLRLASVPVDLELYRGVTHEFIKMGRAVPEALTAHADAARALRRAFHPDTGSP